MTFSSETSQFKVYIQLRPRTHELKRCLRLTAEVLHCYKNASVHVGGLSRDNHQVRLTLELTIANPNAPTAVTRDTLLFAHTVFSTLFDYLPCYVVEPTQPERNLAMQFLSTHAASDVYAPSLEDTLLSAEMNLVTQ